MGAEVIKIERPGRGDDARAWAPPYWGQESATFIALNRNKKSLALDLKSPGGLEILHRLVKRADVFIQSLRPGAIAELGLDFAGATRLNSRIIYCSITAFGAQGPLRHLPGYDPLMQAYSGLMSALGCPELAADERFKDNPARVSNRAPLVEALSKRTRERKASELVETLRASGVPAAPILSVDQMLEEPQTRDSGVLVGASHPRLPDYRSIALPLTWDGIRPAGRPVPPLLGGASSHVLTWLGYT